jgi:hypothetical protein
VVVIAVNEDGSTTIAIRANLAAQEWLGHPDDPTPKPYWYPEVGE